ncbi:sigma-70 family RNA polymerase sigma factor [Calycomorphotria hydatis]|uniref:RNA polymerase sigma factor n=1 Tax=Calycomorphotria hydatis TaxID=2528027 RepID=A0A517T9W0_9PLAN|nr:sigma-70 family RNA polymerase sigma factor [Calycomorphotria hydatis]QDT65161.1 RNA polymerase sigma factor [Calycomorphotria hydatis]
MRQKLITETDHATNSSEGDLTPDERHEFFELLASAYGEIYSVVGSIVFAHHDIEDVVQDTCVKLMKTFGQFDRTRAFAPWACTIARNEAREFLRRQRRKRGFGLSDQVITNLIKVRRGCQELNELRQEKLGECMPNLSLRDQQLIWDCYGNETGIAKWARGKQISENTIYSKLRRLRQHLFDCINRKLGLS